MRFALALTILITTGTAALGDTGAVIVIPGRAGVPVVINGRDASYAVVEGDWGLAKSVTPYPMVYGGRSIDPGPAVGHYYPSGGSLPGYGRYEIQPSADRALPEPAESYKQSWSAQSAPPAVPQNPPAVIMAPEGRSNFQQFRN